MQESRIAFGPFVLDPEAGTLLRDGEPVAVGHRAAKLLAALAARPGVILPKAELMDAAWPGLAVEEANLTVQIAQLRKLLGPPPGGGAWIVTVPRVGYRFAAMAGRPGGSGAGPQLRPGTPSVAVLPFASIGADPEQDAFVDGLTQDLITDLSRVPGLFVIARSSAFAFRDASVGADAIAGDLGVRYLVEGSARRAGGRLRVNATLTDVTDGAVVWAERFDREREDIFTVQDEVAARIVAALTGRLAGPPPRNRPRSLEAYDLCVRARRLMDDAPQAAREAELLLTRAIALDPDYAEAHRWLALNTWMGRIHAGGPTPTGRGAALAQARRAVALDPGDAGCRWVLAYLLAYERDFAAADAEFERAVILDPNEADAWAAMSDIAVLAGRIEAGLDHIGRALRLNPFPPGWYWLVLGQAQFAAGDYAAAVGTLTRPETRRTSSRRFLAASLAFLGRVEEARAEADLFLVANPGFTIGHWAAIEPVRDAGVLQRFVEGFRRAGFPE